MSVLGFAATAEAAPTSLVLSQSAAFSILGHSCGGIQEKVYATGWNATTGDPVGDVYMSTRCGRYVITTYSAWASVTWGFSGSTVSYTKLSGTPTVNPTFSSYDAHGDHLYNQAVAGVVGGTQVYTQAYLVVLVPAAPTNVTVTPSGGQYEVSWTNDRTAPPALIASSTVTATPVGSTASVVTTTVSGNGANALIGPLQPQTAYQITVASTDPAGSSPASAPVSITTGASTIPPGAPTSVSAYWTAPGSPNDTMVVNWRPAPPGDSPTDEYLVTVRNPDTGQTFTQTVSGSTLTATFAVSDVPDYTIQVQAHDAAGWGRLSTSYMLGGV